MFVVEGGNEGGLVNGGASAYVVKDGAGFGFGDAVLVEELFGGGAGGEGADDVVGVREQLVQGGFWEGGNLLVAFDGTTNGFDFEVERLEELDEAPGDGSVTEEEDGLLFEDSADGADFGISPGLIYDLGSDGLGKASSPGEHKGEEVLGAGLVIDGRAVGELGFSLLEGGLEVGAVVSGVAGACDVDPLELLEANYLTGVWLAEGDIGLFQFRAFQGCAEVAGGFCGKDQAVVLASALEFFHAIGGQLGVGPNRQLSRHPARMLQDVIWSRHAAYRDFGCRSCFRYWSGLRTTL